MAFTRSLPSLYYVRCMAYEMGVGRRAYIAQWACNSIAIGVAYALVCLSNTDIVDASRGCTFHCKMANTRFRTVVFFLIVLA